MQELTILIAEYGLALVFANVLLEQLGIPVPATPTLFVTGAIAAGGTTSALDVFAVAILACLLANVLWFGAGKRYGQRIVSTLCRVSLAPNSCIRQSENLFRRWGSGALILGKFVPGLSCVAPLVAGVMHLRFRSFLIVNTIGAAIWIGAAIGAGLLLHSTIGLPRP